jgi:myosin-5
MSRMMDGRGAGGSKRPGPAKLKGSTIIFESVTSQFKRQLSDLMLRINVAHPHFVRCINPNSVKEPNKLEPEMILDQLRCSGLMEAVRVSRAGFPVRLLHADFIQVDAGVIKMHTLRWACHCGWHVFLVARACRHCN